ncbi:MAG TPA: ion channel [Bryobacteraceae bacterium]|jgi:inward rectifier potassium channel|nr:ion channel [Bryobacteraceae bacterium]
MQKPSFDPGLTQQFGAPLRRAINKDGGFNVRKVRGEWRDFHPYFELVNMNWAGFFGVVLAFYVVVNLLFAGVYYAIGTQNLEGASAPTAFGRFMNVFFFSSHTLSTVGYGNIAPKSIEANIVASFEALVGVLGLAVATGLLFGRVSRPSARIGFSHHVLIAPYQDSTALEFRAVNRRANTLIECEARVMLMTVEMEGSIPRRKFEFLKLEREKILFLATPWTIVHPIDSESPLFGKTTKDLAQMQAELLISIKAFDDTFSQAVQQRYSYRHDEFIWGRRFAPAFHVGKEGDLVIELDKIGELA